MLSWQNSRVRLLSLLTLCALIVACVLPLAMAGANGTAKPDVPAPLKERAAEPTYGVVAGLDGDIFPVFANYFAFQKQAERTSGLITVTVHNSSSSLIKNRVAVQLPGWSDQEIQYVEVAAGRSRDLQFAPTFLPRFYRNREVAAATVAVSVTDPGGHEVWATTVPVRLRSADDMYWGKDFRYADFIASWITPHDPNVEMTVSRAKRFMPAHRLPGYETWRTGGVQEKVTFLQAKAIYQAVQREGLSYVKSSSTIGGHMHADVTERVRMPAESLRQSAANCIDGVVLFASLFENLGMEPVVVLVPGHAYVGLRLAPDSDKYLYLETALTARASFEQAVASAERGIGRQTEAEILRIQVAKARQIGIYPLPHPFGSEQNAVPSVAEASDGPAN